MQNDVEFYILEKREVDILINNAGVMCCPKTLTEEGFEWQLGVNYLGMNNITLVKESDVVVSYNDGRHHVTLTSDCSKVKNRQNRIIIL